ncbi:MULTISPECIES: MFS transporter [Cobetia]|nr:MULTISPECIES: MFS transporter [Cobetia]
MSDTSCTRVMPSRRWGHHPAVLVAGILLIAMNLRAPFTSVAPLLESLQQALGFNATAAGLLMILPLLAFVIVSPLVPRLARGLGLERSAFLALLIIALGIVLRAQGSVLALYLGLALVGAGIAIGNVLLPSLVKRDFPNHIALLTSCYVLTMGIMAAIASSTAIPLEQATTSGWRFALVAMLVLPIITMLVWWPQLSSRTAPLIACAPVARSTSIWKSPLAWQVTIFMGFNSLVYYTVNSWLPTILADSGFTAEQAGSLHGVLQLASAVPGLVLVPLMPRLKDQRMIACLAPGMSLAGFIGLLLAPEWALAWVILIGGGAGAAFILALSFVGMRSRNSSQAASLSSMAQTVGYLVAAMGPPIIGGMHDWFGNWQLALMVCVGACALMACFGFLAGRNLQLPE